MVLAKIYSVPSSYITSIYGEDFLDCDALLPTQESEFSSDNFLSLGVRPDWNINSDPNYNELCVRCRYFTSGEMKSLEEVEHNEEHIESSKSDYLHLVFCEEELKRRGFISGQVVDVEMFLTRLSLVVVAVDYDKNIVKDCEFLVQNIEYLTCDKEVFVGKKRAVEIQHDDNMFQVNVETIKCEPVTCGIIDSSTKWMILDTRQNSLELKENKRSKVHDKDLQVDVDHNARAMLIADFSSPLKDLWFEEKPKNAVPFKIDVDHWRDLHLSFINSMKNKWEIDENDSHCLYVSTETLEEFGVQNGSWVKICLHQDFSSTINVKDIGIKPLQRREEAKSYNSNENCEDTSLENSSNDEYSYNAQLFAIFPEEKVIDIFIPKAQQVCVLDMEEFINKTRNTIHVSPLLQYNLLKSATINSEDLSLIVATEKWKPNCLDSTSVPFAQDAHLALVNTPFTKPGDVFDVSVKKYFAKPRLLSVGDIVIVNYDARDSSNSTMADECCSDLRTLYFKVKKLVVSGKEDWSCLVDIEHTSVYQTTAVHSFVPIEAQPIVDKSNYWISKYPPGLSTPTKELSNIIKPYLKQHVNKMPAILLTGPVGVGKHTVVMATGRQFGLCVMNINCYDLIGESIAATETRINNVFQKAMSCRPCILLLRNINILSKDRDGLEDEPRVANAFRLCMTNLKEVTSWPVVVIATMSSTTPLSSQLYSSFLHEVMIQTPTESERKEILEALSSMCVVDQEVSFSLISKKTAGLVLADLVALFTKAVNAACKRLSKCTPEQFINLEKFMNNEGLNCITDDVESTDERFCDKIPTKEENTTCRQLSNDKNSFTSEHLITRRFHRVNDEEGIADQRFHAKIIQDDFDEAIEIIRSEHSDAIGAPKIPNVSWQDIGGLLDVKEQLLDTIQLPLQHPELFVSGLRRSGVLLYGPPGTGKTLLAKAVATECSLNFLSVKGPELINMYVGQSEQNVRQVFSRAQSATPCVIFFDELDSLAPNRGRSGDSGGVMDRVVSQLLAELDGLHKSCDVFVIGATNRPDLLDPALLRPGRFDKLLYLGISEDHDSQLKILEALTKKFELDADCNLSTISCECPLNFTGADLYALCSDAMLHAIKRTVQEQPDIYKETNPMVSVKQEDFLEALENLTPSVPEQELQRYKKIQQQLLSS